MKVGSIVASIVLLGGLCGYAVAQKLKPHNCSSNRSGVESNMPCGDSLLDREDKLIDQHKALLIESGHMVKSYAFAYMVLGRYGWHSEKGGYFGAYSFYQPAFEQAKRAWFINGEVLEGNDELWVVDGEAKFDESIVGRSTGRMSMSWFKEGKMQLDDFNAKIVGIIDGGRGLKLDKRAPHHAAQWQMSIVPDDWVDMCNCTNNFSPVFSGGVPVVSQ